MVQGEVNSYKVAGYAAPTTARSQDSKKAGFANMQKADQARKSSVTAAAAAQRTNNGFGPMFRDRDHFNSLHFC